jgi:predicted dehydrogenase
VNIARRPDHGAVPLPVGILGTRHVHAAGYADVVSALPQFRLVGFAEADQAAAEAFESQFAVPRAPDAEGLRTLGARAVIVAGTNRERLPALEDAAGAGLAALSEKPFGLSLPEAQRIARLFLQAHLPLGVAFPIRFSPSILDLAARLERGELGTVRAIVGENVGRNPGGWFEDPVEGGGGSLTDHVVHLADVFGLLTPEAPTHAITLIGSRTGTGTERTAGVFLDYASGVYAAIDPSWARPSTYPTWGGLSLTVVGDRATVTVNASAQRFTAWTDPARLVPYGPNLDAYVLEDFALAVNEGRAPFASAAAGLKALAIQVAAQRSQRSGRREPVEAIGAL